MAQSSFKEFKNQLWTCIQSCPIVYINHFHDQYVDEALIELLENNDMPEETIVEYDYGKDAIVSFDTKSIDSDMKSYKGLKDFISKIVDGKIKNEQSDESIPKRLFLFKGLGCKTLRENEAILSLLQTFASRYEVGAYEYDTTVIIVSPERV